MHAQQHSIHHRDADAQPLAGLLEGLPVRVHIDQLVVIGVFRPQILHILTGGLEVIAGIYAEHQDFDAGRGEYKTRSIHVFMKAITKQYDIGKLVVGESSETQTTHEVYYLKLYIDGKAFA